MRRRKEAIGGKMIKIDNVWTGGFEGAIRGMRNPYESFDKSDSSRCDNFDYKDSYCKDCCYFPCEHSEYIIGEKDMALCKKLIKAGSEHRKFLRMIHVQADVVAPRYWWAEMSKYKFVEANSSSTMHLITKRELTLEDFSINDGLDKSFLIPVIDTINEGIRDYNKDYNKGSQSLFRAIKQLLPESYNQLRTIDTNYECLLSIYHQRKNHRLSEWHEFCDWIKSLPYMEEFIGVMEKRIE